ncbi:MAG: PcfK-like family protein [Paludibacteraceae bacterium]|nr:PcfK-like family protein [Paludibacteraceae bacterium]
MKSTETFKKTVLDYLQNRAQTDALFAEKFNNQEKNIDDCITYILNKVQKSGCAGFTDDEIFNMAVHYYDEEKIEVGEPISCNVVVNHAVELSEEEKQQAKADAIKRAQDEAYASMTKKPAKAKKEKTETSSQPLLF